MRHNAGAATARPRFRPPSRSGGTGPRERNSPGPGWWRLQLRLERACTSEEYLSASLWTEAVELRCPQCPDDGPRMRGHGSYPRKGGWRVKRLYCPVCRRTCSLLPSWLAAGLSGTLAEVERVVREAAAAATREQAVDALRPLELGLQGALRWLRRRVQGVTLGLELPGQLAPTARGGLEPTAESFAERLGTAGRDVLERLRRTVEADLLQRLPRPLGFRPLHALKRQRNAGRGREPPPHTARA